MDMKQGWSCFETLRSWTYRQYNSFGETALHMAAKKGGEAVVKVILAAKKVPGLGRTNQTRANGSTSGL
jgi:hypothetical protein